MRTGDKYGTDYVYKLKAGIERHARPPYRFVCLTDRPLDLPDVETVVVQNLPLWWGKMALFAPDWRKGAKVIFFDLDMVICGSLEPLQDIRTDFAVCGNFTRAAGNRYWPCSYGSCAMVIGEGKAQGIWERFAEDPRHYVGKAGPYGDQMAIEWLYPDADILQEHLPPGYFLGYRDLPTYEHGKPKHCSVVVFAGDNKPHDCKIEWVQDAWR